MAIAAIGVASGGWRRALACALLWFTGAAAFAQAQGNADLQELANRWVQEALRSGQTAGSQGLTLEATLGAIDSRLKLAPCANVEVYLPPGARLWGKSRVGLRCLAGTSRWNVTVPVTVKALGLAWVVRNPVPSGAVLGPADVVQAPVDWAEESAAVLAERDMWLGHAATRLLTTGQTLRQGMVKPAEVFQAGAPVRVLAQGAGFAISADAMALSAGVVGQLARVRMENGRVSSGMVLDGKTVRIDI
jgi:flagella basal body P-ring formation protein FlgA